MSKKEQNYKNHRMISPTYHMALIPFTFFTMVASIIYLVQNSAEQPFLSSLFVLIASSLFSSTFWARVYALKAQDRAIRAEEGLRYFILTSKRLPKELTLRQIISLRFAEDQEFITLVNRAAKEGTSPEEIKKSIKSWRADHDRF